MPQESYVKVSQQYQGLFGYILLQSSQFLASRKSVWPSTCFNDLKATVFVLPEDEPENLTFLEEKLNKKR